MYINKKSIPEALIPEVEVKKLESLLAVQNEEYGSFEHDINYNDEYVFNLVMTYELHKTKGMKWNVSGVRQITGNGNSFKLY